MNCQMHPSSLAANKCAECNQAICQNCYKIFETPNGAHLCASCFRKAVKAEMAEVSTLKGMVKREFIFIVIGLIVGFGVGLYLLFGAGLGLQSFWILIYLPFVFGSLMTIIKKIKNQFLEGRDVSGGDYAIGANFLTLGMAIFSNLFLAPITTGARFCQRIGDMKKLDRIAQNDQTLLAYVDEYIAKSNQSSVVEPSFTVDGSSKATACDNGETLRTVRMR